MCRRWVVFRGLRVSVKGHLMCSIWATGSGVVASSMGGRSSGSRRRSWRVRLNAGASLRDRGQAGHRLQGPSSWTCMSSLASAPCLGSGPGSFGAAWKLAAHRHCSSSSNWCLTARLDILAVPGRMGNHRAASGAEGVGRGGTDGLSQLCSAAFPWPAGAAPLQQVQPNTSCMWHSPTGPNTGDAAAVPEAPAVNVQT